MEHKDSVLYLIPTKSSALNEISTGYLVIEIPVKTGNSMT